MNKRWILPFLWLVLASPALAGGDWPQWRGPTRDCIAPDGPALADAWPQKGPPQVWTSEKIPGGGGTGYGSVVVADGRVYLLDTPKWNEPIAERNLDRSWVWHLGYVDPDRRPAAELDKKVEDARCSEERAKLGRNDVRAWVQKFVDANLTTDDDKKKYGGLIAGRLNQGAGALTWAELDKVAALKQGFADQGGLEKWLDECGFQGNVRKRVAAEFPTFRTLSNNVLFCLDAKDGKILWKKEYPGTALAYGGCNTPAVAAGKVFFITSLGRAVCLDARSGEELWATQDGGGNERSSSFLVMDGKAVALLGALTALDAAKGTVVWQQKKIGGVHQSPVAWTHEGRTCLICNTDRDVFCVDPKDGSILWQAPGGGWGTPALDGDRMVLYSGRAANLLCYRLAPDKAEKLWEVPVKNDRGASPTIWKGHVYVFQNGRGLCVNLSDGQICWDQKTATTENGSTVVVDGKLLSKAGGGRGLFLTKATPEKYTPLATCKLNLVDCATPAVVDGRVYVRHADAVGCYDLTQAAAAAAGADKP